MSEKTKESVVKAPKNDVTTVKTVVETLNEIAAANRKKWDKLNAISKVGIVLLAVLSQIFAFKIAASYAVLYMFAHNGKFSGRMDGNVMMINGRSRGYTTPALVRNGYTMTARGVFSILSAGFRGLSPSQIIEWNNTSLDATDRRGMTIAVKGKDLYIRLNANLILIGNATIAAPPVMQPVPAIQDISAFTAVSATDVLTVTFSPTPTDAQVHTEVYATAPLSPGVSRPGKSAFRLITVIPPGTAGPALIGPAYVTKFGSLATFAGAKVFIQLYGVQANTGQKVPSVGASAVVS